MYFRNYRHFILVAFKSTALHLDFKYFLKFTFQKASSLLGIRSYAFGNKEVIQVMTFCLSALNLVSSNSLRV